MKPTEPQARTGPQGLPRRRDSDRDAPSTTGVVARVSVPASVQASPMPSAPSTANSSA